VVVELEHVSDGLDVLGPASRASPSACLGGLRGENRDVAWLEHVGDGPRPRGFPCLPKMCGSRPPSRLRLSVEPRPAPPPARPNPRGPSRRSGSSSSRCLLDRRLICRPACSALALSTAVRRRDAVDVAAADAGGDRHLTDDLVKSLPRLASRRPCA